MKTIKFHINISAQDCYIYCGHIFIVTSSGELIMSPLINFIRKLVDQKPNYHAFIRLVFLRNDYLFNRQSEYFFTIPELKSVFNKAWGELSNEDHIVLEIEGHDFTFIDKLPELPVYDMKAYAMRIYISTKSGVYETILNTSNGYNLSPTKLNKVFDQKVINLNAKSGEIFASAANEGLFHGSFLNQHNRLIVNEKPIQKKSVKTSWSNFDIFNYGELNSFNLLENKVEKANEATYNYSKFDEKKEIKKFGEIATEVHTMDELLEKSKINSSDILYCFNTNKNGFFYMSDGNFYLINLLKEKTAIHFSSRRKIMPQLSEKYQKPLSSQIVPNGCVIEFMDNITLVQNNKLLQIEDDSALSLKSYMNSIRYKNLISVVNDEFITLHSVYPFFDDNEVLRYENSDSSIGLDDLF